MPQTVENKISLIPILHSIASCLKLPYFSELVNPTYTFKTIFKISLKAITRESLSQSHDGVHLKNLPTLVYLFLKFVSQFVILHIVEVKLFMKINEYDKINELSNFKCNLAGYINKIIDTPIELSSHFSKKKDSFFRTWNSATSNNGSLIIQFNQLILTTFKMSRSGSKQMQTIRLYIYLVNHSDLSLSQMS